MWPGSYVVVMVVAGGRGRVESEISWLRERGCYAISIFHADNWKPAGQLSSVCKFALFLSILISLRGWANEATVLPSLLRPLLRFLLYSLLGLIAAITICSIVIGENSLGSLRFVR